MRTRDSRVLCRTAFWLACLALASIAHSPTSAQPMLRPHVAEYKVDISVLSGMLRTELRPIENGYRATHVVKATGLSRLLAGGAIRDHSEFEITAHGIRPIRFQSDDSVTRDRVKADIEFDWPQGEARGSVNENAFLFALSEPMHDRISLQYALMLDLINGDAQSHYVLFEIDDLKSLEVRIVGERTIKVPAGKFTAIGIEHQATASKRITTLWCVAELGYLPVIIEQHRKGKLRMRAVLKKYEPADV